MSTEDVIPGADGALPGRTERFFAPAVGAIVMLTLAGVGLWLWSRFGTSIYLDRLVQAVWACF